MGKRCTRIDAEEVLCRVPIRLNLKAPITINVNRVVECREDDDVPELGFGGEIREDAVRSALYQIERVNVRSRDALLLDGKLIF